jgi:hypothetical protein
MTLLVNEIHLVEGLRKTVLVAIADRRLTKAGGVYVGSQPKLFDIPYLKGTVSFMGFAEFPVVGARRARMWEFLPSFVRKNTDATNLGEFARRLKVELEGIVPAAHLKTYPSAFQIAGYDHSGLPDYWWLTNIRKMDGPYALEWKSDYRIPGSHFLGRDAKGLGWDGVDPMSIRSPWIQIYRGGDFRVHAVASSLIDSMFKGLEALDDYRRPRTPMDFKKLALFKFNLLGRIHKEWLRGPLVGDKPDVIIRTSSNGVVKTY